MLDFLYQALASDYGIVIETNEPTTLRARLYTERRACNDPSLDCLSFVVSPTNPLAELWIVKRKESSNAEA